MTVYYGDSSQELFTATMVDDAVVELLESTTYGSDAPLPETVEVAEMRPAMPQPLELDPTVNGVLENLLENLDENYAVPELGEGSQPTEAMREAEREFLAVVAREYRPSVALLNLAGSLTVNLTEWLSSKSHKICSMWPRPPVTAYVCADAYVEQTGDIILQVVPISEISDTDDYDVRHADPGLAPIACVRGSSLDALMGRLSVDGPSCGTSGHVLIRRSSPGEPFVGFCVRCYASAKSPHESVCAPDRRQESQ